MNDQVVAEHIQNGYDGIIFYPDKKSLESGYMTYANTEYVAFYSNQIKLTSNKTPTNNEDIRYSRRINKEQNNERNDEFRRIQEASLAMSDGESQRYRSGSQKVSDDLLGRLSRIYGEEIHANRSRVGNRYGVLSNTGDFTIYEDVEPSLFHDIFEINRNYLENGELVEVAP